MTEVLIKKEVDFSTLRSTFSQIYDEFEDHLHAINENTSEIQENYSYLCGLDNKIAKLNERIDETIFNLTGILLTVLVGLSLGFGFYRPAIFATLLALIFITFLPIIEGFIKKIWSHK